MLPLTWDGCFGWFHSLENGTGDETAIVICPGIGRDSSTGYRSTRFLADKLAQAGYPTLRFSYPGTGDSRDLDGENCWAAWAKSVHAAIDTVRNMSQARQVIVFGIRLGAALAASVASERDDVVGLALLEPVLRGSSYVVQMRVEAGVGSSPEPAEVRLHGLCLSAESLDTIARVDLRTIALSRVSRVLLLSDSIGPVLVGCKSIWRREGVQVAHESSAGWEAFFRPTNLADEPFPDVERFLSWLGPAVPCSVVRRELPSVDSAKLAHPGWVETPHFFGAHGHLFGMLCRPDRMAVPDKTRPDKTGPEKIVIIGNTGGDPHDGFARFGVEFARTLAAQGIASFRMDFAGLGDSVNGPEDRDGVTHTLKIDRRSDMASAIDFVQGMGFGIVALQGLCSGAYHAMQTTVTDPRVSILLCVNLLWFNLLFEKAGGTSLARRDMSDLTGRGVQCLFLFADEAAELQALQMHFGPRGRELAALPRCEVSILPGLDHDLSRPEMRRAVIERISEVLQAPVTTKETTLSHVA
jgi:pimeloyl-ACP methyl ester carboxylesterase